MRRTVLIISFSSLGTDPRVIRQIHFFQKRDWKIETIGYSAPNDTSLPHTNLFEKRTRFFRIKKKLCSLLSRTFHSTRFDLTLCSLRSIFPKKTFDLIVVNDLDPLPIVMKKKGGAKVLLDAHEYAPLEFNESLLFRLFSKRYKTKLAKEYIPQVDAMTTVCEGIAKAYYDLTKVQASVVYNAPYYEPLEPKESKGAIKMIYHGGAMRARKVHKLLDLMDLLDDRFTLDLILVPVDRIYFESIRKKVKGHPRITMKEPVPTEQISRFCADYDVGLYPLEPCNFNQLHALPNKFFEFLQAKIVPAIYPLPEMKAILEEFDTGIVSSECTVESLAERLSQITSLELMRKKKACALAARKYCHETNEKTLDRIIESELGLLHPFSKDHDFKKIE